MRGDCHTVGKDNVSGLLRLLVVTTPWRRLAWQPTVIQRDDTRCCSRGETGIVPMLTCVSEEASSSECRQDHVGRYTAHVMITRHQASSTQATVQRPTSQHRVASAGETAGPQQWTTRDVLTITRHWNFEIPRHQSRLLSQRVAPQSKPAMAIGAVGGGANIVDKEDDACSQYLLIPSWVHIGKALF